MNLVAYGYRTLNILSLDVVAGSIICSAYFCSTFKVTVDGITLVLLGLSVWLIYTTDHLMDVRNLKVKASSLRHRFHQKYFTMLSVLAVIDLITIITLLFFLRSYVLWNGLILLMFVGAYILIHKKIKYTKELIIAVLYCWGILIPVLAETITISAIILYPQIPCFLILVLLNLLLFSLYDLKTDAQDGQWSFTRSAGKRITKVVITILFCSLTVNLIFISLSGDRQSLIIFSLMGITNLLIFSVPNYFQKGERYRLVGDAVFLIPALGLTGFIPLS